MAPRFAFRASKFRNVECSPAARDASYDQLHVTTAAVEGNAVAATLDRFAFAHQIDGGAAIQVKALSDTGKESAAIPPLLRGHQARVNSLEFSPFHANVLLSGSADAAVKVWRLPNDASDDGDAAQSAAAATLTGATSSVVFVKHHPSADDVAAAASHRDATVFNLSAESAVFQLSLESGNDDSLSGLAWNYDGSLLLTSSLNQHVRLVDPRAADAPIVAEFKAHAGRRRPTSVAWCGRRDLFLTTGTDPMQERELKLWDPRHTAKPVARERLDASIGQLFPLYDVDVDLLFVLGKGDRSVRSFEVDERGLHKLNQTLLPHMTLAAALVPKQACRSSECEVARVLSLSANGGSGGVCDPLSFTVPRKDALSEFQRDLFPDTLARTPALSADQWTRGETAVPVLERVQPSGRESAAAGGGDGGLGSVFGATAPTPLASWNARPSLSKPEGSAAAPTFASGNGWGQPTAASPWASAAAAPPLSSAHQAPSAASGWGSKTAAWNAPAPAVVPATVAAAQPVQWFTPATASTDNEKENDETKAMMERRVSDKIARFSTSQGHKLKYIKGRQSTRNESLHLGDKVAASNCLKANDRYLAVPLMGAGGPVLVTPLGATGRVSADDVVLNGHKATVADVDFHPFNADVVATGSSDATIAVWKLGTRSDGDDAAARSSPHAQLRGHTKGVRTLQFHPRAADVLCSTSQDLSIRLWDVEAGAERACLTGKLEDAVWNAAFSPDGSLLATSSRARLVRVFDPRDPDGHALVAMGCGFDSIRPQFVQWLSGDRVVTLGTTGAPRHETQLRIWDARSLVDPLSTTTIESAAAEASPFFDASSRVLFLAGTGGRQIWSVEIADDSTVHANLPFVADGQEPISAAALLPKRLCDVRQLEIDRVLLLRGKAVERVSFTLPRNEKLREFFQDDVFGEVPVRAPSLSVSEWFGGGQVVVEYESLRPADMTPLSEKPEETSKPVPMSQQFRAKWEAEEREKKLKAENLERLQALASQPSLHAHHQRPNGAQRSADDSDDEWDD